MSALPWVTKSIEVPKVLKYPGCSWNQIIVVCKTSTLFFVHFLRLTRRICRTIKSSLSMRSPPTLSWPQILTQGCYCWEKLDAYQCQCSPPFFYSLDLIQFLIKPTQFPPSSQGNMDVEVIVCCSFAFCRV